MKLKTILLLLILLVVVPELLLLAYLSSKYTMKFEISPAYADTFVAFLAFLVTNPVFLMIIIALAIGMAVVYFAIKTK